METDQHWDASDFLLQAKQVEEFIEIWIIQKLGGVSFHPKKSCPQISDLKNYQEELSNKNIIQSNVTLYQTYDAKN